MIHSNPRETATRATARVALVTCAQFAQLDPDDRLLIEPPAARGVRAEPVVWDDPLLLELH